MYYITINTLHRAELLACESVHDAFIECARKNAKEGRAIGRYVIMPDHLHLFARLIPSARLSDFVRLMKQHMTKELQQLYPRWNRFRQPGFFDRLLRSSESYAEKWKYVYKNPVRAGLVGRAEDWPYQGEIVWIDRV